MYIIIKQEYNAAMYYYFVQTHMMLPSVQTIISVIMAFLLTIACGNSGGGNGNDSNECGSRKDIQISLSYVGLLCCLISLPLCVFTVRKIPRILILKKSIKPQDVDNGGFACVDAAYPINHTTSENNKVSEYTPLKTGEDKFIESNYGAERLYSRLLSKTSCVITFHIFIQMSVLIISCFEIPLAAMVKNLSFGGYIIFGHTLIIISGLIMTATSGMASKTMRMEPEYSLLV